MADVPLIAWEKVPEGPVWFRETGADRWLHGERIGDRIYWAGKWVTPTVRCQFALAEQQPGDYASVVAERDALREGIEALEHTIRARALVAGQFSVETDDLDGADLAGEEATRCEAWAERLAALREGRG